MMQLPSELVTTVDPLPLPVVVTALLVLPLPECTVTPLPPVELAVTLPPPAVTELDNVPDGVLSGLRSITLQLFGLETDALVLLELWSSAAKATPAIAVTATAAKNFADGADIGLSFHDRA